MRVIIADDALVTRVGIRTLLAAAGHEVVAEAADGASAVELSLLHRPHVVVLDIRMPPTFSDEGLRAAEEIRRQLENTAVLVLSSYLEPEYATRLIAAFPERTGYLLKERMVDEAMLLDAIRRLVEGECVVDPSIVAVLMRRKRSRDPLEALTDREREVLGQVAEGRSNAGIAKALDIAERTVESHTTQIFMKLGLDDGSGTNRRVLAVLTLLRSTGPR